METKVFHDEVDMPLRVTNVSGWLWLTGGALLLIALAVWLFFGQVAQSVSTCAVYHEGEWVSFVNAEQAQNIIGARDAEIASLGETPVSYQEAAETLGASYYVDRAGLSMWNTAVTLDIPGEAHEGDARDVQFTLETVRPFDLLVN